MSTIYLFNALSNSVIFCAYGPSNYNLNYNSSFTRYSDTVSFKSTSPTTYFRIYRSIDNSKSYHILNKNPYILSSSFNIENTIGLVPDIQKYWKIVNFTSNPLNICDIYLNFAINTTIVEVYDTSSIRLGTIPTWKFSQNVNSIKQCSSKSIVAHTHNVQFCIKTNWISVFLFPISYSLFSFFKHLLYPICKQSHWNTS